MRRASRSASRHGARPRLTVPRCVLRSVHVDGAARYRQSAEPANGRDPGHRGRAAGGRRVSTGRSGSGIGRSITVDGADGRSDPTTAAAPSPAPATSCRCGRCEWHGGGKRDRADRARSLGATGARRRLCGDPRRAKSPRPAARRGRAAPAPTAPAPAPAVRRRTARGRLQSEPSHRGRRPHPPARPRWAADAG